MSAPVIPRKPLAQPAQAHLKEVETMETTSETGWDVPGEPQKKKRKYGFPVGAGTTWALSDRFNRILPPHKKYFGRSRRSLLIVIAIVIACLLVLIIGLAVGLSRRSQTEDLPLPGGAEIFNGDLTYYDPGLSACGVDATDNDAIVSISHFTFDAASVGSNPNLNPLCGRKIRARRVDERTGKWASVDLTVVDRCTGCQPTDIDVSPAMYRKLADMDLGRVPVTWAWL